ncbi:MAG TPA: prepilin-type N-terminal cleavage/methylation domain-containing protein [Methylomirabilota bacterium]
MRFLSDQHGMTLAEVLVALPIITIGLLALLSAIPIATYATADGNQTSTATFLANQRLEQVRNARWSATCQVNPATGLVIPGAGTVIDKVGVSASSTEAPKDPAAVVTFADENPVAAPYTAYSRQVRITDSVVAAPTCTAAGVLSGTGVRQVTVTVRYRPLSATGSSAVSGTRPVSVTMELAQR